MCIRKRARAALTVTLTCALAVSLAGPAAAASRALPADDIGDPSAQALGLKTFRSPGSFTGYGFDRCITPSSQDMDTWRRSSPFAAVGIYISGSGRACPASSQPYLSPSWVSRQHQRGWQILPIHIGLQAPCFQQGDPTPTKPRMSSDPRTARRQGTRAADAFVEHAQHFGLGRRTTLYLDIEWYDRSRKECNRTVLKHIDGFTERVDQLHYRSGLYSSGSAAILSLDVARHADPRRYTWPNQLWVAWGNGKADLDGGPYLAGDYWRNHKRLHQYKLDVVARYGQLALTVDRNWLSVGKGSQPRGQTGTCNRKLNFEKYPRLERGTQGVRVAAAQCLLRSGGYLSGEITDRFNRRMARGVRRMQRDRRFPVSGVLTHRSWVSLLATGRRDLVKVGSNEQAVWRLQRALVAAGVSTPTTGVFTRGTARATRVWQRRVGEPRSGVIDRSQWRMLYRGRR